MRKSKESGVKMIKVQWLSKAMQTAYLSKLWLRILMKTMEIFRNSKLRKFLEIILQNDYWEI